MAYGQQQEERLQERLLFEAIQRIRQEAIRIRQTEVIPIRRIAVRHHQETRISRIAVQVLLERTHRIAVHHHQETRISQVAVRALLERTRRIAVHHHQETRTSQVAVQVLLEHIHLVVAAVLLEVPLHQEVHHLLEARHHREEAVARL